MFCYCSLIKKIYFQGITFTKDRKIVNTLKSHCLLENAKAANCQNEAAEVLFHAYFEEGRDINNDEILVELSKNVSLDENGVKNSLESAQLKAAINREARHAHERGINGVPFFDIYIDGLNDKRPMSFSGAQPPAVFIDVFKKLLNAVKSKA